MSERLSIGTKVYYSWLNDNWEPCALEKEITGYRMRGKTIIYIHKDGGNFSENCLGEDVYLTEEEALKCLEGIKPTPGIISTLIRRNKWTIMHMN